MSKVTNPNQQSNQQSGPPTSQSNNPTQANQNNNQWPQGKSNNPGGLGQNPSVQNNNSSGVQQQQSSGSNANNNQSNNPTQGAVSIGTTSATNNPSTKQQLEQLNTMREALFSHDGWGCVSKIQVYGTFLEECNFKKILVKILIFLLCRKSKSICSDKFSNYITIVSNI